MNMVSNTQFPQQGALLGRRVEVCFNYDTAILFAGRIVRDDTEKPWQTIIVLDDGRCVLGTECQYRLVDSLGSARKE